MYGLHFGTEVSCTLFEIAVFDVTAATSYEIYYLYHYITSFYIRVRLLSGIIKLYSKPYRMLPGCALTFEKHCIF